MNEQIQFYITYIFYSSISEKKNFMTTQQIVYQDLFECKSLDYVVQYRVLQTDIGVRKKT